MNRSPLVVVNPDRTALLFGSITAIFLRDGQHGRHG